jgi:hypothetical protein
LENVSFVPDVLDLFAPQNTLLRQALQGKELLGFLVANQLYFTE